MIKENDTHYFFNGVLHLNAKDCTMRLTRREVNVSAGTRSCSISVAVPKSAFEEPMLQIEVEFDDKIGSPNLSQALQADVKRALNDLPVVVSVTDRPAADE